MSSQRLQAQRAGRQPKTGQTGASDDAVSDVWNSNRLSFGSASAIRHSPLAFSEREELPPPSRDTEFTEHEGHDHTRTDASVLGNGTGTGQSVSDSVRPLQAQLHNAGALPGAPSQPYRPSLSTVPPSPKPALTLRSKFFGNDTPRDSMAGNRRREQLPSAASTPVSGFAKPLPTSKTKSGRNFEYFTGNTVFCWGGRLINTRDRPINIATSLFVVVPAALFFAYS
jgi:palmitoyltransferase ZDHHC9/14/18